MVRAVWGAGLGLFGLAACAAIAASPPSAETAQLLAQTNRVDHFPTLEAAYPGGNVARPHVEFANYTGYRPLQLDMYLQDDRARAAARQVVQGVHGAGRHAGDARQSVRFAASTDIGRAPVRGSSGQCVDIK